MAEPVGKSLALALGSLTITDQSKADQLKALASSF
jgi:hypothetical protein